MKIFRHLIEHLKRSARKALNIPSPSKHYMDNAKLGLRDMINRLED